MSQTAPAQARAGCRRHRAILALLAALACLAGCSESEPNPSGPTVSAGTLTPRAGTATPGQERLGAVSWPADGVSVADISGIGVADGPGATRRVPIASVAKLMTAYVFLQDHPLSAAGSGRDITVEPSEAAPYPSQVRDGDSLVAAAFGQLGTARTILANALQADHSLVLALDRVLNPGVRSGSRHDSEVPLTGHPERQDPKASPQCRPEQ